MKTTQRPLTEKQKRFVQEYLIDLDGEQAAKRAGYNVRSATQTAHSLLQNAKIVGAIEKEKENRSARTEISQDRVIKELAAIGFTTMADVCTWNNDSLALIDSHNLSHEQAAAVAEITETTTSKGGTVRLKLHSKLKALELLAKHTGLFEEKADMEQQASELTEELREKLQSIYGD